jgi:hypothetical protein
MALTMYLWDYILTFEMEVDLVWKSKWNFVKGLYFLQRYLPFVEIICLVFTRQSDVSCLSSYALLFFFFKKKKMIFT